MIKSNNNDTVRVYIEKIATVEGGLPPIEWGSYTPGTVQDSAHSIPIEYNIEGIIYALPTVGKSFTVLREKRNGVKVDGLFQTSTVTEVGNNYFKTNNSVYSYKILKPALKRIKSISLSYPLSDNYAAELNLIEQLCKFQNIQCIRQFPDSDMYRKHYKGLYPAIVIDDGDVVLYGFWSFVRYLDSLGFEEYD